MEDTNLKLIGRRRRAGGGAGAAVWLIAALLALAGVVSTLNGADRARRTFDPREVAETALRQAIAQGGNDRLVLSRLRELRKVIGRRPLDSRTRVVYASLLLSLGGSKADLDVSAFHARVAASLAPVTVPIVRVAALVLASSRDKDAALDLIRGMFEYDSKSAAELLSRAEPLLGPERALDALPDMPEAWLEWSRELYRRGRREESTALLKRGHERWPADPVLFRTLAGRIMGSATVEEWATLFPDDLEIPEEPQAAPLFAYRARYRGMKGDLRGALQDLERSLALGDGTFQMLELTGGVYESIGDYAEARRQWHTALFSLRPDQYAKRLRLLARLARLEQRHGEPAAALRHWRQILEIDPDNEEARRQIESLTGVPR